MQWGKDTIPQNGSGRTWHPFARDWGSVQLSHSVESESLRPRGLQQARPSCSSTPPGVYTNSCQLSWWCHPTISSSVDSFTSHLQSFPASGSFPVSQFFPSGSQCIGVSASASVLPMNIQDWFPLGFTLLWDYWGFKWFLEKEVYFLEKEPLLTSKMLKLKI